MSRNAEGNDVVIYLKILAVATVLTTLAVALIVPQKRAGVDWEHLQFMPREEQGPMIPVAPKGFVWYEEPQARRI